MDQTELNNLLVQHKYNAVWEQCKYIGYNIVPDISTRYCVFMDIVKTYDTSKNKHFMAYYKSQLTYYAHDMATKDAICPENKQLLALRIKQSISPNPDDYAHMCVIRDKLKFDIGT